MSYQGSITIVDLADGESSGINTANIYLYQRSSDTPTGPTGTLRYTFATHTLSGTAADFNGWKQSMDDLSGTDPIWIIAATALANTTETYDDVTYDEWSNPIKMAENGDDGAPGAPGAPGQEGAPGINQATIFLYTRSADPPQSKPASVIYTFADGSFTAPTGWSKTVPQNDGNPCWVTTGAAIGSGTTATIAQNKWADIQKLVEDGINGISPTVVQTAAGVEIIDANGNKTYVNNGVNGQSYYTYIYYSSKQNPTAETDVSSSPGGKEYVGIQTTTSNNPPAWNDPNWNWTKYIGSDGASATTYYAYVKYATDSSGSNMRDNPGTGYDYVGTYTGIVQTPAASLYKWSKYTGDPGQPATPYYAYIKYATDSSGTDMQDSPDNTHIYVGTYAGTAQAPAANLYQWSRYIGADGVSVTEVKEIYCLTNTTPPTLTPGTPITSVSTGTGVWTTVVPIYVSGYTYYTSVQTSLSQGTSPIFSTPIQNQGLTSANSNAATAKAATDLLGGHFIYKGSSSGQSTPSGAGVIQQINDDPAEWGYNTWIGSNGIKLRYGETTLSKWDTGSLIFYIPTTTNGITTTAKAIELNSTSGIVLYKDGTNKGLQLSSAGLEIFGSSQSTADVIVNSGGIKLIKGGIEAGSKNTTDYIYVWSNDDSNHSITIGNSTAKTDWRIIAGNKFGVDKAGNVYATNAHLTGEVNATSGYIGTASDGFIIDSYGFYVGTKTSNTTNSIALSRQLFTRTIDGTSRSDLCFAIGSKFAVDKDGNLYANGANITNINASSLNIGPVVRYGTCTTAKATSDKVVDDVIGFSLVTGAMITVTFTNGNSSSTLTLNVNSTGAKLVRNYNGDTLQYDDYTLSTYVARTFVYNGTYWLLQDTEAIARSRGYSDATSYYHTYVTDIDSLQGITIKPWNGNTNISNPNSNTNFIRLNANGLEIFKEGVSVASYGDAARIGPQNSSNVLITPEGMALNSSESTTPFETFLGDNEISQTVTKDITAEELSVTINSTSAPSTNPSKSYTISEVSSIANGDIFYVKFYCNVTHNGSTGNTGIAGGSNFHTKTFDFQFTKGSSGTQTASLTNITITGFLFDTYPGIKFSLQCVYTKSTNTFAFTVVSPKKASSSDTRTYTAKFNAFKLYRSEVVRESNTIVDGNFYANYRRYNNGTITDLGNSYFGNSIYVTRNAYITGNASISGNLTANNYYPVGSIYINSSNTNPSSVLGFGSWSLIDKEFTPQVLTDVFTFNTSNTTEGSTLVAFAGHTIEIRFGWKNKVTISDSDMVICGINSIRSIGLSSGDHDVRFLGSCDALNAIGLMYLPMGGDVTNTQLVAYDWVTKATSYPSGTGNQCHAQCSFQVRTNKMLDSFCNKFYFKRTS